MVLILLATACNQNADTVKPAARDESMVLVAENIIYDVILKPSNLDDPWEIEKLKGYSGDDLIDAIFESVYSGNSIAYEYSSDKKISPEDVKQMEKEPGFVRVDLGKIQFTESWYLDPETLNIQKEVKSIILGYENRDSFGMLIGYTAAFKIVLSD